ncbi:MAG: hypothetical protein PVF05_01970 [Gemmatimonadales bacterium]|jgi:hypothetical protein
MKCTHRWLAGALTALLAIPPATGVAQDSAPGAPLGTASATIAQRAAVDSFLALVPRRASALIEADAAAARAAEREAMRRRTVADEARRRTRDSLDVQIRELDRARDAIRIANELEQDGRKQILEREARLRERYRDLLSARVEALGQELVAAEQKSRHARAMRERFAAEQQLDADRREWERLHGEAAVVAEADERRADQAERLQQGLRRYFEARRDEEREAEKVAAAHQELAVRRLRVLELRRRLFDD